MASSPITSWQIEGESGSSGRFSFGGPKITADGDCSHKIKWCLLLGRKAMTNLDSILKSRDITLPTKVHIVKAMVFPVVMYGCESWTIKKAERQRIVAFELQCWRRDSWESLGLQGDPTSPSYRRSVLGVHWKDWCWSRNSDTLATWCEELTHWKRLWWWERLKAGGEGDERGRDGWMASPTRWTWVWTSSWSWWWTGRPGVLQSMELQRVGHDWATELNWTELGTYKSEQERGENDSQKGILGQRKLEWCLQGYSTSVHFPGVLLKQSCLKELSAIMKTIHLCCLMQETPAVGGWVSTVSDSTALKLQKWHGVVQGALPEKIA